MSNELIVVEQSTTLKAFSSGEGLDPIIQQAKDVISNFAYDLSTAASRAEIASMAAKVAKLKTSLDGVGKELVSDWKAKSKLVDASRKKMRDELDLLKIEARRPLTEWEKEQKEIEVKKMVETLAQQARDQKETDHEMGLLLNNEFDRQMEKAAEDARQAEIKREESRKAEQDRRDEAIKQQAIEEQKEKTEKERLKAIAREESLKAAVEASKRKEAIAKEAKKKAVQDAIKAAEKALVDAAVAKAQAKKDAEKAAEDARQAEIAREADETKRETERQRKLEANKKHVDGTRKESKEALMKVAGIDDGTAKTIVLAIHKKQIPNIYINY